MDAYLIALTDNNRVVLIKDFFMVHGARNLKKAFEFLEKYKDWDKVRDMFCQRCGELKPCGCHNPL